MSSSYVRTQIKNFIGVEAPTENLIDLSSKYNSIHDLIKRAGYTPSDPWLGVSFIGAEELPVSTPANNTTGLYREFGTILLHVVSPIRYDAGDLILARAEALRDSFRGSRIGDVLIESVGPPNTEDGATLQFEGGYTSASVVINYYRDLKK